jgi:hypothetical protein
MLGGMDKLYLEDPTVGQWFISLARALDAEGWPGSRRSINPQPFYVEQEGRLRCSVA